MEISDWRKKIDETNEKILSLLNERARYAIEIGSIKKKSDLPVHDEEREKRIKEQISSLNKGPLSDQAVWEVFDTIITETKALEADSMENV